MTADNGLRGSLTEQDREQYEQRWTDFMVKIWQEKMMKFSPPVYDTGALYQSLTGVLHPGTPTTIEHHFLEYGIYVAAGTGNGYRRGNSGSSTAMPTRASSPMPSLPCSVIPQHWPDITVVIPMQPCRWEICNYFSCQRWKYPIICLPFQQKFKRSPTYIQRYLALGAERRPHLISAPITFATK